MKNIRKTALREIKGSLGRFMAILAIIALGVGFFSGVKVTTPAMVNMMGDFMNENDLYDYRIVSYYYIRHSRYARREELCCERNRELYPGCA